VGDRRDTLQRLVGLFKFERAKAGYIELADLLLERLPQLPPETVIVPVPTVRSHVRQRGYDHTALIARYIAEARKLTYQPMIERKTSTVQRGASARLRKKQADQAFSLDETKIIAGRPYLVVDDVTTTGATLIATTKLLRKAGVKDVWAAVIARQALDQ
jgi:ComF family protein